MSDAINEQTIHGHVDSLRVRLGNVEIVPVNQPGGKTTRGYRVLVNGEPIACRGIKITGDMDSCWEVELKMLPESTDDDGKRRVHSFRGAYSTPELQQLKDSSVSASAEEVSR